MKNLTLTIAQLIADVILYGSLGVIGLVLLNERIG